MACKQAGKQQGNEKNPFFQTTSWFSCDGITVLIQLEQGLFSAAQNNATPELLARVQVSEAASRLPDV